MPSVPEKEIQRRHLAMKTRLGDLDPSDPPIDLLIVVQKADLYYLSGTIQQCHLLFSKEGSARLLVRKVLERAQEDSAVTDIRPMRSLRDLKSHVREVCGNPPWRIGMELDVLPVNLWKAYEKLFGEDAEIVDGSGVILATRAQKSDWELEQFRQAAAIHRQLFEEVPLLLAEGVSTYQLQTLVERRACELGHCGMIRMRGLDVETSIGVVVSGEEGALPSHSMFPIGGKGTHPWVSGGGSFQRIQPNTPVILDYLMSTSGYHADCTRMAVKGEFPDEAREIFKKIQGVMRLCEESLKVGAVPSKIYQAAVDRAADEGLSDGFMGPKGYQVGFVGHGVGLEVNEVPVIAPRFDKPLVVGNTLAIEPKYTHPEWGVIGLENSYAVREDGPENLTPVPEDIIS